MTKIEKGLNKGITLIALVITIIILLILAGVSIATLAGEGGILNKAHTAKTRTGQNGLEELIKLAIMTARTRENYSVIDLEILEKELKETIGLRDEEIEKSENEKLPWTIKHDEYIFQITGEGKVNIISGVLVNKTMIKLLKGESEKIIATKTEGLNGNIIWSTSDPSIAVVEDGNITAIGENGRTEIIATVSGTDYYAKCTVIIVAKVTTIIPTETAIEIERGSTKKIEVTTVPAENVEELKYESMDPSIATVNENGVITGVTEGETTVTITGKVTTEIEATIKVKILRAPISVTAEEIITNPEKYYGKIVANYMSNATYRIFYVDKDNYFGDGKNTIYLKADAQTEITGSSIGTNYTQNTLIRKLNPQWANKRGNSSWNSVEKRVAWLSDPESTESSLGRVWSSYFDKDKANYVVAAPSFELYVRSYNQVSHSQGLKNVSCTYYRNGGFKVWICISRAWVCFF